MTAFQKFEHAIPFAAFFLLAASVAVYSWVTDDILWSLFAGAVSVGTIYAYVSDLIRTLDEEKRRIRR